MYFTCPISCSFGWTAKLAFLRSLWPSAVQKYPPVWTFWRYCFFIVICFKVSLKKKRWDTNFAVKWEKNIQKSFMQYFLLRRICYLFTALDKLSYLFLLSLSKFKRNLLFRNISTVVYLLIHNFFAGSFSNRS